MAGRTLLDRLNDGIVLSADGYLQASPFTPEVTIEHPNALPTGGMGRLGVTVFLNQLVPQAVLSCHEPRIARQRVEDGIAADVEPLVLCLWAWR